MAYTRGSADDYDRYARLVKDAGWSWDRLQPYFRKVNNAISRSCSVLIELHRTKGLPLPRIIITQQGSSTPLFMDLTVSIPLAWQASRNPSITESSKPRWNSLTSFPSISILTLATISELVGVSSLIDARNRDGLTSNTLQDGLSRQFSMESEAARPRHTSDPNSPIVRIYTSCYMPKSLVFCEPGQRMGHLTSGLWNSRKALVVRT
jgi:hypothetical protein